MTLPVRIAQSTAWNQVRRGRGSLCRPGLRRRPRRRPLAACAAKSVRRPRLCSSTSGQHTATGRLCCSRPPGVKTTPRGRASPPRRRRNRRSSRREDNCAACDVTSGTCLGLCAVCAWSTKQRGWTTGQVE